MKTVETPVLVIGGGPVGLSLALDLGWRGQNCMLVEKTAGNVRYSKMGSVAVRTMEFARRWGIKERIRAAGFPEDYPLNQVFCTSLSGHLIATTHYPSMRDQSLTDASPEKYRRCPQCWFDPVLADCARDTGFVDMRHHCEVIALTQDESRVLAEVRDVRTGETFGVAAQYAVGCDGPGSTVRRLLDVPFEGNPVLSYSTGIYLDAPALLDHHDKPKAERYVMIGREGNWGSLTIVDGVKSWRLTVNGTRERVEAADFDADWWVRRAFGSDAIPFTVTDVMPWRRSQLVVARYQEGRVFLAGDAAHIMAPNGGYGMNTGVADAVDLAWKLAAVLQGWGGGGLLASYDAERRPIGWRNVNIAASNFVKANPPVDGDLLFDDSGEGVAARRAFGRELEEATRAQWERLGVVLGHRYEGSPVCVADGTAEPPDDRLVYLPASRPGHRAPHAWLSSTVSTLDLFGRGFVLLCLGSDAPDPAALVAAARVRNVPLEVQRIAEPAVAALYERRLVLVRPDGHVAWRADALPEDAGRIVDVVRGAAPASRIQAAA